MAKITKTEQIKVRLTPEARAVLDELSKETGKTVSELIRRVLLDKYGPVPINRTQLSVTEMGKKQ